MPIIVFKPVSSIHIESMKDKRKEKMVMPYIVKDDPRRDPDYGLREPEEIAVCCECKEPITTDDELYYEFDNGDICCDACVLHYMRRFQKKTA